MTRAANMSMANQVPATIVATLRRVIGRTRLVVALRGTAGVLAVALVGLLGIMAVDRFLVLDSVALRWALTLGLALLTALSAVFLLVRPLVRTFSLRGVARLIESRHPELQERVSSTVELLSSGDAPELRGSEALIDALASEAAIDVRGIRAGREVTLRKARPFIAAALGVIAVIAGLAVRWPDATRDQLMRSLNPAANIARVSSDQLKVHVLPGESVRSVGRDGVDYALLRGRRMRVRAEVSNPLVGRADIRFEGPDAAEPHAMKSVDANDDGWPRFEYATSPATKEFEFSVRAGRGISRRYAVAVVDPPAVEQVRVRQEYPEYAGKGPKDHVVAPGVTVPALAGSKATVTALLNRPVDSAEGILDGEPLAVRPEGARGFRFDLDLAKPGERRWALKAVDAYGFENEPVASRIDVVADEAPDVKIVLPGREKLNMPDKVSVRLKPGERLPFGTVMRDDLGLRRAWLRVTVNGRAIADESIRVSEGEREAMASCVIDLARKEFEHARRVTFQAFATDTLPGEEQVGASETYSIVLDRGAKSYYEQVAMGEELEIREALKRILAKLNAAGSRSATLIKQLPRHRGLAAKLPAGSAKVIEAASGDLSEARTVTNGLSSRLADEGTYIDLAKRLADLATSQIGMAEALITQVRLNDHPDERMRLAKDGKFKIERAIERVEEMLKQLHEMVEEVKMARVYDDLAEQQAHIAKELADALNAQRRALEEEMAAAEGQATEGEPGERQGVPVMSPDALKEWQDRVSAALGRMMKSTPGALPMFLKKEEQEAKDLVREAGDLRHRQQEIAADTRKIEKVDEALARIAAAQRAEAKKAAKLVSPAVGEVLEKAAERLEADDLPGGIERQKTAENVLSDTAAGKALPVEKKADSPAGKNADSPPDKPSESAAEDDSRKEPARPTKSQQAQAQALGRNQASLRKQAEALLAQRKALLKQQAARLLERQKGIAKEAADLADEFQKTAPSPERTELTAARKADEAAKETAQGEYAKAAQAARDAAGNLARLAGPKRPEPSDEEPASEPDTAEPAPRTVEPETMVEKAEREKLRERADKLAGRQKAVADELELIARHKPADAAASQQRHVARQVERLAKEVKLLDEHAKDLGMEPAAQREAAEAAAQAQAAKNAAEEAARRMPESTGHDEADEPDEPRKPKKWDAPARSQQQAIAALTRTAQALQRLGRQAAKEAGAARPAEEEQPMVDPLELMEAFEKAQEAAETGDLAAAEAAAAMLGQLTQSALTAARQQGLTPTTMNRMVQSFMAGRMFSEDGSPMGPVDLSPVMLELRDAAYGGDWARLHGRLDDEVVQGSVKLGPREYRDMIRRYAEIIAGQTSNAGGKSRRK